MTFRVKAPWSTAMHKSVDAIYDNLGIDENTPLNDHLSADDLAAIWERMHPYAKVIGTWQEVVFDAESDYTYFTLKWE